jgi:lipopolysaccharide/colanic/teichoic acid biosynthesis glycosyltransferase
MFVDRIGTDFGSGQGGEPQLNGRRGREGFAMPASAAAAEVIAVERLTAARTAPAPPLVVVVPNGDGASRVRPSSPSRARVAVRAALKRGFDIAVSLTLLSFLLPVVAITALLVLVDSAGPVFFRVERVGHRGRSLRMLKFRKMRNDAAGLPLTVGNDHRFTRIGTWLAKTKMDELPQLWQVLRGEMSLVGPRPEDPGFVARHEREYETILRVRPGITGLSQIAFAGESAILDEENPLKHYVGAILPQKVLLDQMYAERGSVWLDLRILFWTTAAVIFRRQVAVHRNTGKMNLRRRPAATAQVAPPPVDLETSSEQRLEPVYSQ